MLHIWHALDPHLFQMWWLGMITLENPTDHTIDLYPQELHPIYHSQSQLRWKQLFYEQITKEWTHYISFCHPELDAIKFYAKIIQIIWERILEIWTTQNQDNNTANDQFPPNMLSEINGIYALCNWLPPHTQDLIFKQTKEELLLQPKQYIQNWITHSTTYICHELRILAKQCKMNIQDIWNFFPPW